MIGSPLACANHILNRDATFAQWVRSILNGAERQIYRIAARRFAWGIDADQLADDC